MVTLKDVAYKAEVSISTVSRVLNNDITCKISDETREKVLKTANELNYVPNQIARELAKRNVNKNMSSESAIKIGCLFGEETRYMSTYFTTILSGIQTELRNTGCSLSIIRNDEVLNPNSLLYNSLNENFFGMIILEDFAPDIFEKIKEKVKFIVGINSSYTQIDSVSYDMLDAAENAVRYLVEKGHRRIAYIGGPDYNGDFKKEKRYKGYINVLRDSGISEDFSIIKDCEWDTPKSYSSMNEILDSEIMPTALFAASDMLAIAALQAVNERGLKVPEDIAIIGIDNLEMTIYTHPPLSSVEVPKAEMGRIAVQMLISRINGDNTMSKQVILPTKMIIRKSSG